MIKVTDIRKRFGALEVLRGVSLDVAAGEVVSVVGASGAGKTTLLQILGTLSAPDSGRVEIDGTDTFSLGDKALSKFRNERIGFVFQFHHLLPEFTAFENVCIPGYIGRRDRGQVERRAAELLALLGLTPRRDHKPGQLSGGEQQRVAIARALVNSPAVLLADEPSGNLDSRNRDEIHRLFFELRDRLGQTTVIVTHDESLAAMADRRIVMSDGRIVADAPLVFPSVRAGTSAESRPVPDEPLSVEPKTSRSLGESLPGDRTPDRFVPGESLPGDRTSDRFVPGESLPGDRTPDRFVPGESLPGDRTPDRFVPGESLPGDRTADRFVPGESLPGDRTPDRSVLSDRLGNDGER